MEGAKGKGEKGKWPGQAPVAPAMRAVKRMEEKTVVENGSVDIAGQLKKIFTMRNQPLISNGPNTETEMCSTRPIPVENIDMIIGQLFGKASVELEEYLNPKNLVTLRNMVTNSKELEGCRTDMLSQLDALEELAKENAQWLQSWKGFLAEAYASQSIPVEKLIGVFSGFPSIYTPEKILVLESETSDREDIQEFFTALSTEALGIAKERVTGLDLG